MLRIMTWNVEWFTDLFEDGDRPKDDGASVERLEAIAHVIGTIDPDVIGLVEAPHTTNDGNRDTRRALAAFADRFGLRLRDTLLGFPSDRRQEIALWFDPDRVGADHDPGGDPGDREDPPFGEPFEMDSDGDDLREVHKHARPPLEARITRRDGGADLWTIVVHAKSKGIFSNNDRVNFDRISERNRRRLFAECLAVRKRADDWLARDRPLLVMGDINDGPGFDFYENRFGRSAVEIVMGRLADPDGILRNHLGEARWGRFGWEPSSARFRDSFTGDPVNVLIDYVLVSRHLPLAEGGAVRVWNPFQDERAEEMKSALLAASDHFPVVAEIA